MYKQHYLKYPIRNSNDDLSVRFYYRFDSRKSFEGNWYVKSHSLRKYTHLDTLEKVNFALNMADKCQEIYGGLYNGKYIKMIKQGDDFKFFEEKDGRKTKVENDYSKFQRKLNKHIENLNEQRCIMDSSGDVVGCLTIRSVKIEGTGEIKIEGTGEINEKPIRNIHKS